MKLEAYLHINPDARLPIIVQLSQQLTWLIASEVIHPGEQLPPIRTIAATLGIHMHTVRAAYARLQSAGLVSMRTKQGTIVLPFKLDALSAYSPSLPSFLYGVLVPHPASVYQPYIAGIHQASLASYWLPIISYNYDDPEILERSLNQLLAKGIDGLIVTSALMSEQFFQILGRAPDLPLVFVDAPQIRENCVLADLEGAAYLASSHLLWHGHKRVALITAPVGWGNVRPCLTGYRKALAEAGVKPDPTLIIETNDFQRQSGYSAAMQLLSIDPSPEAVFVIADELAIGALSAFKQAGVRIPGDMALTSHNDIEAAALVTPGLTSATFPGYEMGVQAVELLQELMTGGEPIKSPHTFDTELIIRQSCGCQP